VKDWNRLRKAESQNPTFVGQDYTKYNPNLPLGYVIDNKIVIVHKNISGEHYSYYGFA
jgi:hypothetical protein